MLGHGLAGFGWCGVTTGKHEPVALESFSDPSSTTTTDGGSSMVVAVVKLTRRWAFPLLMHSLVEDDRVVDVVAVSLLVALGLESWLLVRHTRLVTTWSPVEVPMVDLIIVFL